VNQHKLDQVRHLLRQMGSAAVAFSGGVDSALLAQLAYQELQQTAVALTAVSPSLPKAELEAARTLAAQIGIRHVCLESYEIQDERYRANTSQRCYWCKQHVYARLQEYARQNGYAWLLDGANQDDAADIRPGRKAAGELGVRSPLAEAGLTKAEIRQLALQMGLPNWDKPASACLSSRLPYGTPVTEQALAQIEKAEAAVQQLGFTQARVRHHGEVARLEVEEQQLERALELRQPLTHQLRQAGFRYVTLDLQGYRMGSLNEMLEEEHEPG